MFSYWLEGYSKFHMNIETIVHEIDSVLHSEQRECNVTHIMHLEELSELLKITIASIDKTIGKLNEIKVSDSPLKGKVCETHKNLGIKLGTTAIGLCCLNLDVRAKYFNTRSKQIYWGLLQP